jgi:hypothetical protein
VEATFHGVCQVCSRRLDFPADLTGLTRPCPHCGRDTRLKPAPVDLLDAAAEPIQARISIESSAPKGPHQVDQTELRLKRSILRLTVVTMILIGVLLGLVAVANWLTKLMPSSQGQ